MSQKGTSGKFSQSHHDAHYTYGQVLEQWHGQGQE